jgi:hypothetical protein
MLLATRHSGRIVSLAFYLYLISRARSIDCCAVRSLEVATCDLCASVFCFGRKKVSVLQVFYGLGPTVSDFGFSDYRRTDWKPLHCLTSQTSNFIQ